MTVSEWYCDALSESKHRRLDHITNSRSVRGVRSALRRFGYSFLIYEGTSDTVAATNIVKQHIVVNDVKFLETWTSFRTDEYLIFAFKNNADAIMFKLLLDK